MPRYEGQGLPESPRIAVIANDAIGNFVVATPLLQMLRRELKPTHIHYYGGIRTLEMQEASDLFEWSYPLHGRSFGDACRAVPGPYDLVVNVERTENAMAMAAFLEGPETYICGPCLGPRGPMPFPEDDRGDLWRDQEWISPEITSRYPFLTTGFIGEMYTRLAYLKGPVPGYRVPTEPTSSPCDVLVATSASLPDKLWPVTKWVTIFERLRAAGLKVGLIGAKPSVQKAYWEGESDEDQMVVSGLVADLRGEYTLPQVAGILASCKLVLTLDNGILHLACAGGRPVVGLFRNGIHRLWAPPHPELEVLIPPLGEPVSEIELETVWEACRRRL
jgi:ADP-heptose:LPS heptosyltransferase